MEILGVVKLVPVPKLAPPVLAAYQFNVPTLAVACKLTVPMPQRLFGVVLFTEGMALTVTNCVVVAEQPLALVMVTV